MQVCKKNLHKATAVQKQLRDHVASIPDLEHSTTQSLMSPLPTASDLFGTGVAVAAIPLPSPSTLPGRRRSNSGSGATTNPFAEPRLERYDAEAVNRQLAEAELARAVEEERKSLPPKKANIGQS